MARPSSDQGLGSISRRAVLGVGLGVFLSTSGAFAEALQTKNAAGPGQPSAAVGFEKDCDDIRGVFELARFKGDYQKRSNEWLRNNCRGPIPYPSLSDPDSVKRFNTSARILMRGANISIAPPEAN